MHPASTERNQSERTTARKSKCHLPTSVSCAIYHHNKTTPRRHPSKRPSVFSRHGKDHKGAYAIAPIACGPGPSRSTLSTLLLISPLSRTRLPKYFLATSDSALTLHFSARCSASCSTLRCRPVRNLSAGNLSARRTSLEMREALVCV